VAVLGGGELEAVCVVQGDALGHDVAEEVAAGADLGVHEREVVHEQGDRGLAREGPHLRLQGGPKACVLRDPAALDDGQQIIIAEIPALGIFHPVPPGVAAEQHEHPERGALAQHLRHGAQLVLLVGRQMFQRRLHGDTANSMTERGSLPPSVPVAVAVIRCRYPLPVRRWKAGMEK
jgi:hypothetical protein